MIDARPFYAFAGETLVYDTANPAAPAPPVVRADPRKQIVGASARFGDELSRLDCYRGGYGWHSTELYRRMYDTPAVSSSFNVLRAGILQGKLDLLPAAPAADGDGPEAVAAKAAVEVCESNKRMLHLMETPLDLVLWEMAEAMYLGHVLAEVVFDDVKGGPDDGLWFIRKIRPLRLGEYKLVVDQAGTWIGVECNVVGDDGQVEWKRLGKDKFWLLTWDPYRGDPRGRSIFRQAVHAWQMLVDLWPDILAGWKQFGTPMLVAIVGPDAEDVQVLGEDGTPVTGVPRIPIINFTAAQVQKLRGGATIALDHGGDVKVVESNKDAGVVAGSVAILEAQIKTAILLTPRTTTEAKFGSRADSETASDTTDTSVRVGAKWLERGIRDLFRMVNTLNYGPDVARQATPLSDLGSTSHQDFAGDAAAAASLASAKILTPSMIGGICTRLNLAPPTAAEMKAMTEAWGRSLAPPEPGALPGADGDPNADPSRQKEAA